MLKRQRVVGRVTTACMSSYNSMYEPLQQHVFSVITRSINKQLNINEL